MCIYMYVEAKCCLFLWSVEEGGKGQQTGGGGSQWMVKKRLNEEMILPES